MAPQAAAGPPESQRASGALQRRCRRSRMTTWMMTARRGRRTTWMPSRTATAATLWVTMRTGPSELQRDNVCVVQTVQLSRSAKPAQRHAWLVPTGSTCIRFSSLPGSAGSNLACPVRRARLSAMNELAREMELAERAEKRDDAMQRRQMLQKQRQQQKAPARKVSPCAPRTACHVTLFCQPDKADSSCRWRHLSGHHPAGAAESPSGSMQGWMHAGLDACQQMHKREGRARRTMRSRCL